LYANYAFAAYKTNNKDIAKEAIENFLEDFTKKPDVFKKYKDVYSIVLNDISSLYALIGDKKGMIEYLKETKKVHPKFISLKNDEDFKEYWEDKDFLVLFK